MAHHRRPHGAADGGPYWAGDGSVARLIVRLSIRTHIPYTDLIDLPPDVLAAYIEELNRKE